LQATQAVGRAERGLEGITKDQWRAFIAAFGGWVLDGFDFMILSFILIDIQAEFSVDAAAAGLLGTVTMLMRLVGGVAAGTAADKWGRKGPLMVSILWFSIFAFLCGFAQSYAMLFALRALFGIGMGGEFAAAMPLTLEHWPARLRGLVSGVLQSGFSCGYMLAALAFRLLYPVFNQTPGLGWRAMFWIGVLPALLVLWIRKAVKESPVWLERQRHLKENRQTDPVSLFRLFERGIIGVTIQTTLVLAAFIFSYHSSGYWYPTFLREQGLQPFWYVVCLNAGAILGSWLWGFASEGRLGRRGAASLGAVLGILMVPLFLMTSSPGLRMLGALLLGIGGPGMWGIIPTYLSERFPTAVRGVGPGFSYHAGAAVGSVTPYLIGGLRDRGVALNLAMAAFIVVANLVAITTLWLGPEPRGRRFDAADDAPAAPSKAATAGSHA
jgi:SHS family lactate transporter-like MFS transporter